MDAWTDDILSKAQRILDGKDPWAAPPRSPSPLRAETPPFVEASRDSEQENYEEEDLFGEATCGWRAQAQLTCSRSASERRVRRVRRV